jgi:argininosuccinate synthase
VGVPQRCALDAFILQVQARVSGTVRARLFKGSCHVAGVQASIGVGESPVSRSSMTDA